MFSSFIQVLKGLLIKFPVTFYAQIMESGELRVFISKMMFKNCQ